MTCYDFRDPFCNSLARSHDAELYECAFRIESHPLGQVSTATAEEGTGSREW